MEDAAEYDEQHVEDVPTNEFDQLFGIFADGVVGALSGFVGMTLLTGTLLVAESLSAFDRASFAALAELGGLEAVGDPVLIGFLIFFGHGMITWPLLFAALEQFLPGGRDPVRGAVLGTAIWTGFVQVFNAGYAGETLWLFLGLTLVGHWAYGFGLGSVFEYYRTRPDTIV